MSTVQSVISLTNQYFENEPFLFFLTGFDAKSGGTILLYAYPNIMTIYHPDYNETLSQLLKSCFYGSKKKDKFYAKWDILQLLQRNYLLRDILENSKNVSMDTFIKYVESVTKSGIFVKSEVEKLSLIIEYTMDI